MGVSPEGWLGGLRAHALRHICRPLRVPRRGSYVIFVYSRGCARLWLALPRATGCRPGSRIRLAFARWSHSFPANRRFAEFASPDEGRNSIGRWSSAPVARATPAPRNITYKSPGNPRRQISPDGRQPGGIARGGLRAYALRIICRPLRVPRRGSFYFFVPSRGCAHVVRLAPAYIISPPVGGLGMRLAFARRPP